MADFVIVIAAIAGLAGAAPTPDAAATTAIPLKAPTAGFRTYPDVASCEQAAALLAVPPGRQRVCLPVELPVGELAGAF